MLQNRYCGNACRDSPRLLRKTKMFHTRSSDCRECFVVYALFRFLRSPSNNSAPLLEFCGISERAVTVIVLPLYTDIGSDRTTTITTKQYKSNSQHLLKKRLKKETPETRGQCRFVKEETRIGSIDSGKMPSGRSDTSRESDLDTGATDVHAGTTSPAWLKRLLQVGNL